MHRYRFWGSAALCALVLAMPVSSSALEQGVGFACGDPNGDGVTTATDALAALAESVGSESACRSITCDVAGDADGVTATDALALLRAALGLAADLECPSIARIWIEELLGAIRVDIPRPTVHARNLFHLSAALWDVYAAYSSDPDVRPYNSDETAVVGGELEAERAEAMSYAAYRLLVSRFTQSIGADTALPSFQARMLELGCDPSEMDTVGDSPSALGNRIGQAMIDYGMADGANESADYADTTGYFPVNDPMIVELDGATMVDPNRWQPLSLEFFVTQNGIPIPADQQEFITPHWDDVLPFALTRENEDALYADPGDPPYLGGVGDQEFRDAVALVLAYSSGVDPADGVTQDISPASLGNNPLGTNDGTGHATNPATGAPYEPNVVATADYGRVLAEFWADGPDSETPPGHWNSIAHEAIAHPDFERRIGGEGDLLEALDWDVRMYLALNGAMHDAAVAGWGAKAAYDYVRPISMIRYMGGLGQSSDAGLDAYDPNGLPLVDDLIEIITAETTAPGGKHENLAGEEGKIAVRAWRGNPDEPETETGGVGWILAESWVPYQRETFVTPAFAAYVSGHSAFSRSGAEVLTRITGDAYFPGGLGEFVAPAGSFLEFEFGPTQEIVLQWATYRDAADEAGLSRLWGGIHVPADDFEGRIMGEAIGNAAYELAETYWTLLP